MTAEEWFNGVEVTLKLISLKPDDMIPCTSPFLSLSPLPPPALYLPIAGLSIVSQAPVEKKKTAVKGSSYQRVLSEKEKEELAMKEMFDKAKRLDFDDEDIEGIPKRGNTDAGFDDDDWS